MEYEIYHTVNGDVRVNIGGHSYGLTHANGAPIRTANGRLPGAPLARRDLVAVERGVYGPEIQAYAAACREVGIAPRCSWRGVMNALGDAGFIGLPWKPRYPRDAERAA